VAAAGLPIDSHLSHLVQEMATAGATVVLQAPPGAGKTSRVPLALLESLGDQGKILLLEPRRIATRNAALRLSQQLQEEVGRGRIGYRVRLERRVSATTRLEVLTGGLFLRQLQEDPALEGVACVILDEFHERSADVDLALALLRQARELLRPDLRLLLMSATLDAGSLCERIEGARLIRSEGRSWPVEVGHQPPRPQERQEQQVMRALEQHWLDQRQPGETVLVFLPGRRELLNCQRAIAGSGWAEGLELVLLHGQMDLEEQSRALAPARRDGGKVVLATSVAESSLTIEGVTLVIDSGLSRRSRFDPSTGMDGLITLPASLASAEQRRGRAGRLGPGRCLRLWSPAEQLRRPAFDPPELLEVDPVPIALQLARWGAASGQDLPWLDPPPAAALAEGRKLLRQLGGLDACDRITPHGQALSQLGLHPRLAHMLLEAESLGWLTLGCELAVLLSEPDPLDRRQWGCDLLRRLDWLRQRPMTARQRPMLQLQRQLQQQVQQLRDSAQGRTAGQTATGADPARSRDGEDTMAARLVCMAYPDRIALGRGQNDGRFLLRSGRGARLPGLDPLSGVKALAVAGVDDQDSAEARVLLALPLPLDLLQELGSLHGERLTQARWDPQQRRVQGEIILKLDALILERSPWPDPDPALIRDALLEGLRQLGVEALPWDGRSRSLQQRLCLAHRHLGAPWPDRSPQALERELEAWLGPHLEGLRSLHDLEQLPLEEILWGDLAWSQRQELDQLLPETLPIPSGRRARLNYGSGEPVLAVKLQELFGCPALAPLLGGRLPITVELHSPAGRAAAITRDLEGFWRDGYAEVRRELRGRYPRHPWPEDPRQATATALSKAGLERQQRAAADSQGDGLPQRGKGGRRRDG